MNFDAPDLSFAGSMVSEMSSGLLKRILDSPTHVSNNMPSGALSGESTSRTSSDQRHPITSTKQVKSFEEAYKKHEATKYRRALRIARATRESLNLERKLAVQRLKEAELYLDMLRSEADFAVLRLQEADLQVGMVRALLHSKGIKDDSSEDLPMRIYAFGSDLDSDEERDEQYLNSAFETQANPQLDGSSGEAADR